MEPIQLISIIFLGFFVILSLFVIINLGIKYKKEKKKNIGSLLMYTFFCFSSLLFFISSLFLSQNSLHIHYNVMFSLILLTNMLYFINRFSRALFKSESGQEKKKQFILILFLIMITIALPQNNWYSRSLFDEDGSFLKIISYISIIIFSSYVHYTTIKRGFLIENRILDPLLKETYIYINRCFKFSALMIPSLILTVIIYIIPRFDDIIVFIDILGLIFILLSMFSGFFSMIFLSIAVSLPKWLLRRFYEKYSPMWSKESSIRVKDEGREEKFKEALDKLYDALFD